MNQDSVKFIGDANMSEFASLFAFWRWAFSDICDDDIKGIFAEWMVGTLLGLPMHESRRVSWADSDLILPSSTRVEVKASAVWQSWKLVNENGTSKPLPVPVSLDPARIRFGGLQARTAVTVARADEAPRFKSDFYVFCMHAQTDPASWSAWNLSQWEFYLLSQPELVAAKIGQSISLARLRQLQSPMTARQFQDYAMQVLGLPAAPNNSLKADVLDGPQP